MVDNEPPTTETVKCPSDSGMKMEVDGHISEKLSDKLKSMKATELSFGEDNSLILKGIGHLFKCSRCEHFIGTLKVVADHIEADQCEPSSKPKVQF